MALKYLPHDHYYYSLEGSSQQNGVRSRESSKKQISHSSAVIIHDEVEHFFDILVAVVNDSDDDMFDLQFVEVLPQFV